MSQGTDDALKTKQIRNLFHKLNKDPNSVLYTASSITNNLLKKLRKSSYQKDKSFLSLYINTSKKVDNINVNSDDDSVTIPHFVRPVNIREYTRGTLYSVTRPLELMHADVADIRYLKVSGSEPKYLLLVVDLYSSKIYTYPMKDKASLAKKLLRFYDDINQKRKLDNLIRIQTDMEFEQNEIKKLNKKCNIEMFSSKLNDGHAFAAEQKVRSVKELLSRGRDLGKRKNLYKLITDVTTNLNNTKTSKYSSVPNKVEELTLSDEHLNSLYNTLRVEKVQKDYGRKERADAEFNKRQSMRQRLRELNIGDKVLAKSGRLKKSDQPGVLNKSTTSKLQYFSKKQVFKVIGKRLHKNSGGTNFYYYWLEETETGKELPNKFIRKELFALKNNTK